MDLTIIFIAAFVGWFWKSRKNGRGKGVSVGGGVAIAVFMTWLAASIFPGSHFSMIPRIARSSPPDLKAAGLEEKTWDSAETELARQVSYNVLSEVRRVLIDSDKRGDIAMASATVDPLLPILGAYNDQSDNPQAAEFRDCGIAAIQLSNAMQSIQAGRRINNLDRVDTALEGCNP